MQQFFNIIAVIAIVGLIVLAWMQYRALKLIDTHLIVKPATTPSGTTSPRTEVSADEFWDQLKGSAEKITLEFN